jgi:hypothetical protein
MICPENIGSMIAENTSSIRTQGKSNMVKKTLTIDQVELIFSLFIAQNADKMISDFGNGFGLDAKVGNLFIRSYSTGAVQVCLRNGDIVYSKFRYMPNNEFFVIDFSNWSRFDIFSHISFEDRLDK